MSASRRRLLFYSLGLLLLVFLFVFPIFFRLNSDLWWFSSLSYRSVFGKILGSMALLFAVFFSTAVIFVPMQLGIAKAASPKQPHLIEENIYEMVGRTQEALFLSRLLVGAGFFFALLIGVDAAKHWQIYLLFLHPQPYPGVDPLFHKSLSFYIFTFPFVEYVIQTLLVTAAAAFCITLLYYAQVKEVRLTRKGLLLFQPARTHLCFLLAVLLILIGLNLYISRYDLLFQLSRTGNFPGADFTDVHFTIPGLTLLSGACLAAALLALLTILLRSYFLLGASLLILVLLGFLTTNILPSFAQRLLVEPNELVREKPYLGYALEATRKSFALERFREAEFSVQKKVDPSEILRYKSALANIRLWDYRPYLSSIRQLQGIWPYYTFLDVDFDRYTLHGEPVQVAIAVRELDHSQLPRQAIASWISRHFTYTHGIGTVISPVSSFSEEGLPTFLSKDIPPQGDLKTKQPQIYFGEMGTSGREVVFVKSREKELDYPAGEENVYTRYRGRGGVPLSSFTRRLIFSVLFQDIKILISQAITPKTRILLVRNIRSRAQKIAPYLLYDSDPYPVVTKKHIVWILDAYTVSATFPYSAALAIGSQRIRTMRNSVKVTIDAYDGTVTFYTFDSKDPILKAYSDAFPGLFHPLSEMPKELRAHIRYPLDLFYYQAKLYTLYHTTNPQLFYSRQDVWALPQEVLETDRVEMEPYYVLLQDDPAKPPTFSLMLPFTPDRKGNMTAWMAGHIDPQTLKPMMRVFRFPKEKITYGPIQIEGRIDTDAEISKLFTLWRQKGSRVIRGNLLVIPIARTVLYVEPVYLQAEQNQIPELKRVIVGSQDAIALGKTFQEALKKLGIREGGKLKEPRKPALGKFSKPKPQLKKLIQQADQALRAGDLKRFGELWEKIRATPKPSP